MHKHKLSEERQKVKLHVRQLWRRLLPAGWEALKVGSELTGALNLLGSVVLSAVLWFAPELDALRPNADWPRWLAVVPIAYLVWCAFTRASFDIAEERQRNADKETKRANAERAKREAAEARTRRLSLAYRNPEARLMRFRVWCDTLVDEAEHCPSIVAEPELARFVERVAHVYYFLVGPLFKEADAGHFRIVVNHYSQRTVEFEGKEQKPTRPTMKALGAHLASLRARATVDDMRLAPVAHLNRTTKGKRSDA